MAAGAKLTVGISDNDPAMFSSPQFQRLQVRTVRAMVFWNIAVMKDKKPLNAFKPWAAAAKAAHMAPMISFAGNGNFIPSTRVYTKAVRAFMRMFPQIKIYTPWNEPDWIYRPKLSNNPRLAASYFNVLTRYCHHCTIVAGDVYRAANHGLASWVRSYARWLNHRPAAWALHPYDDVRTHTTKQLRAFQRVTRGPIWFDEISGVLRRGHWQFRNQSSIAAGRDERFLFSLPKRFHRITRIYHYQWQGTVPSPNNGWDSGLIGPAGVARPSYFVVLNAAHGKLP